eukprot:903461-Pelagomonas_calceolata.AAC.2
MLVQVEDVDPVGPAGPFNQQCECVEGYGDYGCQQEVTHIQTGESSDRGGGIFKDEGMVIREDEWRYYQIEVCVCVCARASSKCEQSTILPPLFTV